ncbi:MAG: carboxypeptidase regulatory-like domain-containing protein [Chloroflexota bacterium]
MSTKPVFSLLVILALTLGACGSPGQATTSATQPPTALPPTAPPPTPTPTPLPVVLEVTLTNPDGGPVVGATVTLGEASQVTGADGLATFSGLQAGQASLQVTAPGYFAQDAAQDLQPGDNQAALVMQPDPDGLLPENACAPGEKLLYIEDFQDGLAQGWDSLEASAPGWKVEADPDQPGNQVLSARKGVEWAVLDPQYYQFQNAVWRVRFKFMDGERTIFNFRLVPGEARYMVVVGGGAADLNRNIQEKGMPLGPAGRYAGDGWHLLEVGLFDGMLGIYIDGKQGMEYQDPQPWEAGTIALENHFEGDVVHYYDNIVVCELAAPMQPMPRPKTGFDLNVTVLDAEGNPIPNATVVMAELGEADNASQVSDAKGLVSWTDLPGAEATLQVGAMGYRAVEQKVSLQKDTLIEQTIILERDPFGLLPEQACAPGETLLYSEDFQDGKAQGWPNISAAADLNAQNGWAILPDEAENANLLLQAANGLMPANDDLQGFTFDNAVWRLHLMVTGQDTDLFLNWRHSFEQGDWRYFVPVGGNWQINMVRFTNGGSPVAQSVAKLSNKKWFFFEISTFEGVTEVWLNGKKLFSYTDPQPLPPGTIGLEAHLREGAKAMFFFDNISVCELTSPFVTMPQP